MRTEKERLQDNITDMLCESTLTPSVQSKDDQDLILTTVNSLVGVFLDSIEGFTKGWNEIKDLSERKLS